MKVEDVQDDDDIMQVLDRDRAWAAYAITDLDPPYRQSARFIGAREDTRLAAVVLLFGPPVFTTLLPYGDDRGISAVLQQHPMLPSRPLLHVSEAQRPILQERYELNVSEMYRMVATPGSLRPAPPVHAEFQVLSPGDLDEVQELFKHSESGFFPRVMLHHALNIGARVDGRLVAVAGTHTRSDRFKIATIGNVLTHPDFRGRGLATAVTARVAEAVAAAGSKLLALNVRQDNGPAIAAYRRVGFEVHMPYWEGNGTIRGTEKR